MKRTTLALVAASFMVAGPAFAQGTAGGTQNTGPQGTGNFVAGKPEGTGNPVSGKPGDPQNTGRSGSSTGGAGGTSSSTSSGDMGNTNNSKK